MGSEGSNNCEDYPFLHKGKEFQYPLHIAVFANALILYLIFIFIVQEFRQTVFVEVETLLTVEHFTEVPSRQPLPCTMKWIA